MVNKTLKEEICVDFLVNDQRDAHISFLCIYFYLQLSTCFEHIMLIIRRDKLYQYSLW